MKQYIFRIAVASAFFVLPHTVAASTVALPDNTLPITSAEYTMLQQRGACYMPIEEQASDCSDVEHYLDRTLLHTQEQGRLYRATIEQGGVVVQRYLPDGFYVARVKDSNRYFHVQDGVRTRLKKGRAFKKMQRVVSAGLVIPISETDFSLLSAVCEYYPWVPGSDSCLPEARRSEELRSRLTGSVLWRLQHSGELVHVQTDAEYRQLSARMGKQTFFSYVKQQSQRVQYEEIRHLPRLVDVE